MTAYEYALCATRGDRSYQEDAAAFWPGPATFKLEIELPPGWSNFCRAVPLMCRRPRSVACRQPKLHRKPEGPLDRLSYTLTDNVGAYTEWFALFPNSSDTAQVQHYFNGDFTYLVHNDMQFDV